MLKGDGFCIRLAHKVIRISPKIKYFENYCKDYLCDAEPDFSVTLCREDVEYERERSVQNALKEEREVEEFSDSYLGTLALYRKIAEKMPQYNTLLIHGSCVAVDGEGYLFTATSGTGKSTHTRLWREAFGDRAKMVNDDKPLVTITENGAVIHGTPWNGKHHLGENISVPLKAICILKRGTENRIEEIDKSLAYPVLLGQAYRPRDAEKLATLLSLLDKLGDEVDLYELHCNMDPKVAEVAYGGMNKSK